MADLQRSQADWDDIHEKIIYAKWAPIRELRELFDKFNRTREQVRISLSTVTFFDATVGDLTLIGAQPSVNKGMIFFVRFTGNAGARVVSVYSATGASGLIAQGTAADGAVATLAEQNASGVSGTWPIPSSSGNTTADELTIQAFPDWQAIPRRVFPESGAFVDDDSHASRVLKSLYADVAVGIDGVLEAFKAGLSRPILTDGDDNPIAIGNFFTVTALADFVTEATRENNGAITRTRAGWIPVFRDAQEDETTAGEQFVVESVPSSGVGVFDADNDFNGAVAAHTPFENARPMKIDFTCDRGKDTNDIGRERWTASVTFTETGDEVTPLTFTGPTINQPWTGPFGFGTITVTRILTKTGDGSDLNFAAASGATVSGETNTNTDTGTLGWKVDDAGGGLFDFSFYSSSTAPFSESDLVAKATGIAAAAAIVASAQNSSGLTVNWTAGSAPVDLATGTLQLNTASVQRSNDNRADSFFKTVTVAAGQGLIQKFMGREYDSFLNSTTASSENVEDDLIRAGTFPPFAVQDN